MPSRLDQYHDVCRYVDGEFFSFAFAFVCAVEKVSISLNYTEVRFVYHYSGLSSRYPKISQESQEERRNAHEYDLRVPIRLKSKARISTADC